MIAALLLALFVQELHTITATARDEAGNTASDSVVVLVDNRPVVSITSPKPNDTFAAKFTITASSLPRSGNPIKMMDVLLDGVPICSPVLTNKITCSTNFNPPKISIGAHRITVRAWDTLDFQGSSEVTVYKK